MDALLPASNTMDVALQVLSSATELFLNRVIYEMMSRVTLALIDNGAPNLKVQFQLIPLSSRRRRPNQQLPLASSN